MAGQNQTQNMDLFDSYFRRADLDQDGRINGSEAVAFFQGFNLPQQVLAQIWMHADQNRTGFLGRAEFYNALKLATVAQSKRELSPDIVKAALYGPASAKIPAPQINLAGLPTQSNSTVATPVPQVSGAAPTASQHIGIRGPQVPVNASMDQQVFPSQRSQFMRPPRPMPSGSAFRPQQIVASQGMPGGVTVAVSHPPSSAVSTDWLGGRTGGTPAVVTSQVPNRGNTIFTTPDGFGLAAPGLTPSAQPRPQTTSGLMQSAAPKPHDPTFPSNQVGTKDSKALVVAGNGFAADSVFGDAFSATLSQPKHDTLVPTSSASGLPVSSAIIPASGSQPTAKPSPLGSFQSTFTEQSMGNHHQEVQSTVKQNQQVSANSSTAFTSTGLPVGAGNSVSGQAQHAWPRMTQNDVQKYTKVFLEVDKDRDGKITGEQARNLFLSWRLPREVLKQVWDLSDQDNDSMLSLREFCNALYLMERYREGRLLPTVLPSSMFDESLLPAAGQRAPAYGNANWGSSPGLQQPKGMIGAQPVIPAAGLRPPSQVSVPQADESMQPSQQKPRVPGLEKHLIDQLSKEEQDSLNSKFQEATEADKKVEELEKEILDSKEKIEFCRAKMQELILYKSRCDNRLNEIIERASADKREVESLAKKYEEKYKQVGDVASKLTIEEATFRGIQAKKMELYQAIVKMEQDGGADDIQARADRIQLDLEELVKSLNERCKTYGLRAKPTALVELPFGWQPGIQEGSADWNEDWDKFEDEGFTLVKELTLDVQNIIAPPKPKSSVVRNEASSRDEGVSAISSSNADGKSEKLPSPRKGIAEDESTDAQSEEGTSRTPPDSPAERNVLESPSKRYQDSEPRKDIGADGSPYNDSPHAAETQSEHGGTESVLSGDKTFDEPSWGAFDTHYDTDSVWDFNTVTSKDMDQEKHNESSFFNPADWGLNPIRTQSIDTDNTFQKKSTLAFADSVPSTPMSIYGNSPHVDNMFQKRSPFAFADSIPSTPMFSSSNSPRRLSEGLENHSFDNFSRFDSFSMHDGGLFPQRESLTRFDSIRSTRDSDYGHGFFAPPADSFSRFDSFRSTKDSDSSHGFFPAPDSLTRFDSIRSTRDADYSHGFPSFDDTDPFGSSGPFKTSLESQTPRRDSDIWRAF